MKTLYLNLKKEYFESIKSGQKTEEYRLYTPYWRKRLENRPYDQMIVMCGYPPKNDSERRLTIPYNGYEIKTIDHEFFGSEPVKVFAIKINLNMCKFPDK